MNDAQSTRTDSSTPGTRAFVQQTMRGLAIAWTEFEARLDTLKEQQSKARENARKQIDARMDDLKASHEARKAKLEEARQRAKASVESTRKALVS